MAIRVVMDALNKLELQHNREQKRAYWRDKHLKGRITRIARQNIDALQWLIYFESEAFEKAQEQSGGRGVPPMIISYIKHLLQISTPMSAFYVSVGLHRLLHNYSTSEIQRAYERVTEHYAGSQEYRRVKGSLMLQLQKRFGGTLQTVRGQHGEVRFEIMGNQESYFRLVDQCLRYFTPWSTRTTLRAPSIDGSNGADPFGFIAGTDIDPDNIETCRCHVFIDPDWFAFVTRELGLDPPQQRLSIPRFYFDTDAHNQDTSGGVAMAVPELTDHELDSIFDYLSAEAKRRNQSRPKVLKVLAHGIEYARVHADGTEQHSCELPEGAKLIEIWIEQDGGDVLIATHWVNYTEWLGIAAAKAIINLGNNREMELTITPIAERPGSASLALSCRAASNWQQGFWRIREGMLAPRLWLLRFGFGVISLIAMGWIIGSFVTRRELSRQRANAEQMRQQLAQEKALRESLQQKLTQREPAPVDVYHISPDDLHVRTNEPSRTPVVRLKPEQTLATIELPVADVKGQHYRVVLTQFLQHEELLSEVFPGSSRRGASSVIDFELPANLVQDGQHYVINVSYVNSRGTAESYRTFTFLVLKQELHQLTPQ